MKKNALTLSLIGIVALSFVLRFWGFPERIRWEDTGTELFAAYHITEFAEYPLVGVHATSIDFYHPPWYLYVLGFFFKLVPSITNLEAISMAIHALVILPVYGIGLLIFGAPTGLLAGLLFATHPKAISLAYSLQSQNIIVPVALLAFYLWLLSRQKKYKKIWPLSVFVILFAVSINYAALILVPVVFVWGLIDRKKSLPSQMRWISLWCICSLLLFLPLIKHVGISTTALKLFAIPVFFLSAPTNISGHYINIFLPFVFLFVSLLITHVFARMKNAAGKIMTIAAILPILVFFTYQTAHATLHGDYKATLACARGLITEIRQNQAGYIILVDPQHQNNWTSIIVLIEQALGEKLAAMRVDRGSYYQIDDGRITRLVCMNAKSCADQFIATNPAYLLQHQSDGLQYCQIYTFVRE